ncbi:MAG TPA: asparagine--tRNA ligase [Gemmatimonadales bacterium]|jgi:asparaginyl-tRNA synthetase
MPTSFAAIADLHVHQGETVSVRGWVMTTRSSGKIAFVVMRDGSGYLQAVFPRNELVDGAWERLGTLTHEANIVVTGTVRADARAPGGYELTAQDVTVVAPSVDFPITPKEHGTAFLFEHRHLWLRSRRQVAVARVRNEVEHAISDFFYDRGFIRIDTPILTGSIGENAGELFATDYFDLGQAYLAQTGQLYVEAAAAAHGKVYSFGPTFRAEKSKTRRHLTEFWMCEPEVAFADSAGNMRLQEEFVTYLVARVLERRQEELKELERDTSRLEKITVPFARLTYTEAIDRLKAHGTEINWGDDLGADDETVLGEAFDTPLLIMNYPKAIKAFYMKENPDDPRTVLSNDCLAPEGYGEIIGGSQREDDHDRLRARITEQGLDPATYQWYLDLRKYGGFVHSGFGLGLERTVAWICGIPHIREAIAFPRQIHRLYP